MVKGHDSRLLVKGHHGQSILLVKGHPALMVLPKIKGSSICVGLFRIVGKGSSHLLAHDSDGPVSSADLCLGDEV